MRARQREPDAHFERLLSCERPYVVNLCARRSGDLQAAEDLAQEVMLEAWRHRDRLRDQSGIRPWLSAIASNVYLRWRRTHYRSLARHAPSPSELGTDQDWDVVNEIADDFDVEVELERAELVQILDRALALLTPSQRAVLIHHYIEELPHAEVAGRLGLSEPAVAMRLQRGKLALRRLLKAELGDDAASYGIPADLDDRWDRTRIWCWQCGERRLLGRLSHDQTELRLRCPNCCRTAEDVMTHSTHPSIFKGARSYANAIARMLPAASEHYRRGLAGQPVTCPLCGAESHFVAGLPPDRSPYLGHRYFVHLRCSGCGAVSDTPLSTVTITLPEGWQFWQAHRRIRMFPEWETEQDGSPVVITTVGSVETGARLSAVYARDSLQLLGVYDQ